MGKPFKSLFPGGASLLTLLLTAMVLSLFVVKVPILDLVELKTYDLRFRSRKAKKPLTPIALAVIDEKSLDIEGQWPWPRAKIARLIRILSEDGAKVIGFDICFAEPDKNNSLELIRQLEEKIRSYEIDHPLLKDFISGRKRSADNDLTLARAIREAEAKVVLGHFFYMSPDFLDYDIGQGEIEERLHRIENSRYPIVLLPKGTEIQDPFAHAYAPETNIRVLSDVADSSGYFNMISDPEDGVLRRMELIIKCGKDLYAPLSVQVLWNFLDRPTLLVRVAEYGIEGIQIGETFVPTDERGRLLINYLGPEETFTRYPISDILNGRFPRGTFKDKIVLVGSTAIGLYDIRNTPVSSSGEYPGLEVHATIIDNILREDFLHKPEWAKAYDVLVILFLGLISGVIVSRTRALKGFFLATGLFISYALLNRLLFASHGIWLNLVYPLLALVLVYVCLTVFRYFTEERERRKIGGAFNQYVSKHVVSEMLKNPERLRLGGDKKELSVLFSDIRGFTTISETMPTEELVQVLNEYLTSMTEIVFRHEGTLDKYMGDALMAIFGAPLDQFDHPIRACASALDMTSELARLNDRWVKEGKIPLEIGIGINTGIMMVGNMGSVHRFDYTVIGDAVNLASRLEAANKNYRTNILISESTYEKVKSHFECLELDSVRVKGKVEPVRIYHLMGRKGSVPWDPEAIQGFHAALEKYKERRWDEAVELFQEVVERAPGLHASHLYIKRCLDLKSNPPPPEWDGVFTMAMK
ncbi:MAG: adenylate/guanylate cyclase domain-containing protein [Deltaproteobacteria bacterium]|nr:adenylate/guanylate cyclase domain-containing protein [Deltaproteobacteria bacterium]